MIGRLKGARGRDGRGCRPRGRGVREDGGSEARFSPDPLEKWASPPFQPTIRNGRVYARGACDNKGNLAARLCALDLLLDAIGEVPLNIKFLIEGEEEIGSPHLSRLLWLMQQEGGGTIFTCRRGGRGIKLVRRRDNHITVS